MKEQILKLLQEMVDIPSLTNTEQERKIEDYLYNFFYHLPYFATHSSYFGQIALPGDPYGRRIVYGLVKGKCDKTVVLLNHHDVVGTEVYGKLETCAYKMKELAIKMQEEIYDEDTTKDLASGEWLFGRGSCDMKGGIAAQLAVLEEYSKNPCAGNLLFVSVPDEESFSAGMRGALWLFEEFQKDWNLDYKLLINCEPNEKINGRQIVPIGSVGKLLPVVLIQGKAVQIGSYYKGINPLTILARLICLTEGDPALVEKCGTEMTVPPVWSFARDLKESYDFSLPQRAVGYCNILTFAKTPLEVMELFLEKCREVASKTQAEHKNSVKIRVMTYAKLLDIAKNKKGFASFYTKLLAASGKRLGEKGSDYIKSTINIMQEVLNFTALSEPVIIIAFAPPYYPATNSIRLAGENFTKVMRVIEDSLQVAFKQYFLGVSDCSYCGTEMPIDSSCYITNTPIWGSLYSFDMDALNRLKIPFVLLGPWGKDLHQSTERVNINSLTELLPCTLQKVMQSIWKA